MTDIIERLDYILKEDYVDRLGQSKVIKFLDQNKKKTDHFGGNVRVSTTNKRWAFGLGGGTDLHFIQAVLTADGKWKVNSSQGIAKVTKNTLTDDEMLQKVKAIFDKSGEKK
jgi:hypothetical protein